MRQLEQLNVLATVLKTNYHIAQKHKTTPDISTTAITGHP